MKVTNITPGTYRLIRTIQNPMKDGRSPRKWHHQAEFEEGFELTVQVSTDNWAEDEELLTPEQVHALTRINVTISRPTGLPLIGSFKLDGSPARDCRANQLVVALLDNIDEESGSNWTARQFESEGEPWHICANDNAEPIMSVPADRPMLAKVMVEVLSGELSFAHELRELANAMARGIPESEVWAEE
jgi:hypothetical protein